jgi:hypothetical protein
MGSHHLSSGHGSKQDPSLRFGTGGSALEFLHASRLVLHPNCNSNISEPVHLTCNTMPELSRLEYHAL